MKLIVNIAHFDNNELIAFGESINTAVKNLTGIEGLVQPFQNLLTKCKSAVSNTLEKTSAKEVSALLKKEDNLRDKYLIGLKKLADACEYHPNETVSTSATKISLLFDKLSSGIHEQSYDKESTTIRIALTDLQSKYATDVEQINGVDFVSNLAESQNRFDNYRNEQLSENAEMAEVVSMSSIRREFEHSIRAILDVLPAFYMVNQSAEYKTAIGLVNESIQKFK